VRPPAGRLTACRFFVFIKNMMSDKLKLGAGLLLVSCRIGGFLSAVRTCHGFARDCRAGGRTCRCRVASRSELGGRLVGFSRESWAETKKVVWPTRKETIQTTGVVFLLVVVLALFLWIVDASLMSLVKILMGQGD